MMKDLDYFMEKSRVVDLHVKKDIYLDENC